ncbi:VOC family protein [Pseudonocardia kujensis]|uniref:VOC family protein n=1 Tax=Pseudonocardia kujensis TaxID=1128675 RepID=UPI001E5A3011|nr:VOC family protein [Pseudonocardia kujensis]MCE0763676.1 VOC family protein [Pseudonocardia kujensis]
MPFTDTPWPNGAPCWADIAVPDLPAALAFYGAVVGWSFVDTGEEYGHFNLCQTEGRAAAGIGPVMQEGQPSFWTLYLATDDVEATTKLVTDGGGSVLAGPMDIPETGRMAVCSDPTGGVFGLWQAAGQVGIEVFNQPGSLVWEDARLTDVERGREFYAGLFPYRFAEVPGLPLAEYGTFGLGDEPLGGMGGTMGAPEGTPSHWLVYFGVESVDAAVAAATERGGGVVMAAQDTPFGRMAVLGDPFGAPFAVHQEILAGDQG